MTSMVKMVLWTHLKLVSSTGVTGLRVHSSMISREGLHTFARFSRLGLFREPENVDDRTLDQWTTIDVKINVA